MRRYLAPVIAFQVCPPDYVTTTPNSLAFVTYEGESYLIAAMQTEGILRHTPTGSWERLNVVDADPTPYTASNNSQAFILMLHEALNWLGGALLTVWLIRAWQMQAVLTQSHSRRICFWVIARLVIAIVLLLGWLIFTITFSGAAEVGYLWPAFFVGLPILGLVAVNSGFWPLLGVLGILIAIAFVIRLWLNIDWPKIDKRPLGATIIIAVTILLVGYAPFPFWAQGIIAEYNVARYIALGATVIVWLAGGFWIKRLIVPTQQ